jgi:hypothetical protein
MEQRMNSYMLYDSGLLLGGEKSTAMLLFPDTLQYFSLCFHSFHKPGSAVDVGSFQNIR